MREQTMGNSHANSLSPDPRPSDSATAEAVVRAHHEWPYTITAKRGEVILVDREDWERFSAHPWYVSNGYAVWFVYAPGQPKKHISLARAILEPPPGFQVDHINGDRLDNRRENLRVCTAAENTRNSRKRAKGRTPASSFKGVFRNGGSNRMSLPWRAEIKADGHSTHLGTFANQVEAAMAYDAAARKAFGEFARLNFPLPGVEGGPEVRERAPQKPTVRVIRTRSRTTQRGP